MQAFSGSAERGTAPVPAADLAALSQTFAACGAVHVRGAVDPGAVAQVRAAAAHVYAERERLAQEDRLPAELAVQHLRRFASVDDLRLSSPVLDLLGACFWRLGRQYLQHDAVLHPHSHVRWISPERGDLHLPFHQDQTIAGTPLLNVWIPLVACGTDAPGLQVVRGSWRELLAVAPLEHAEFAADKARIDEALVAREFDAHAFWNPEFEPGDAMIFAGATAHRTYLRPGMSRDRMSLELRLV